MPEAVKEVVLEVVPQAVINENSPDKIPCKEVKPAEASSGTLPADEEPAKDSGEGAVAPDLGQGDKPEEGKSDDKSSVAAADGNESNPPEEAISNESQGDKNTNTNGNSVSDNPDKQTTAEEAKEASDESSSQESKQPSPEECQVENSKEATSPEQSKTEESMDTDGQSNQVAEETQVENTDVPLPQTQDMEAVNVEKQAQEPMNAAESKEKVEVTKMELMVPDDSEAISNIEKVTESTVAESTQDKQENICINETQKEPEASKDVISTNEIENQTESEMTTPVEGEESEVNKRSEPCHEEIDNSTGNESVVEEKAAVNGVESQSGEKEMENVIKENGNTNENVLKDNGNADDGAGRSKVVDENEAEALKQQIVQGKGALASGDNFTAADVLGKACEIAEKLYGDLADENAELYYLYGCAMLECAKNEANVLGEAVKDKEEEEDNDEGSDGAEVNDEEKMEVADKNGEEKMEEADRNGEEKMEETDINGEEKMEEADRNGEEKMAVDGEEEKSEKESEQEVNGQDAVEKNVEESTKENEEEEETSLKVAWEMFELAKLIFTRIGNDNRLADTYIKLGEVGIESGHKTALDDLKTALELRKKCSPENQRVIAETHFNIGLTYGTLQMFDEAIEQFQASKSLLEAKIEALSKLEDQKAQDEVKEIKELIPDLDEKIQDMKESQQAKLSQKEETVNGGEKCSTDGGESSKPASNISHLVKRKRKLEDVASDLLPNTKQPCTETSENEATETLAN